MDVNKPSFNKSEKEVDQFYGDIQELLRFTKPHVNIIIDYFIAKASKSKQM